MYIEIHTSEIMEQKALYFKLSNAFNMDNISELNRKFYGIYAIFDNNTCLYVGQSKNLASRAATHLRGKYEKATSIYLWDVEEIGFSDFEEREGNSKKIILDNCEKYLMTILKPIDNLDIDMDFKLAEDKTPDLFEDLYEYTLGDDGFPIEEINAGISSSPSFIIRKIGNCISIFNKKPEILDEVSKDAFYMIRNDQDKAEIKAVELIVDIHMGDLDDAFTVLKVRNEA